MKRRSFESAVLTLESAKEAVLAVSMSTHSILVADRRMTDALDVLSAIMGSLPAVEADFTRSLIRQCADEIEAMAVATNRPLISSWASPYLARMRTIAQGGPRD